MQTDGTIDITNIVEGLRGTFVTWGVAFLFAAVTGITGFGWLAWPIIAPIFRAALEAVLNLLTTSAEMEAFFINTTIRKSSQASDYVKAVSFKNSLPPTATDKEYQDAEKAEMAAFRSFVMVTN